MSEAIFGFIGVLVGCLVPWIKDWLDTKKRARYLAIRVVCLLDEYVEKCCDVVRDDGTFQGQPAGQTPSGELFHCPQVGIPSAPAYPDDVDWQSIDAQLMYRLLSFPKKIKEQHKRIDFEESEAAPGWMEGLFEEREKAHVALGLEAIKLADDLRSEFNIPQQSYEGWNPKQFLKEKSHA